MRKKGRHLYQIQKSVKVNRVGSGNRREETVLTRLRLGHCALSKTLKMIGKHQTGLCEGCQGEESVEHVLLQCRKYRAQREMMRNNLREIGVQEFKLKGLLSMVCVCVCSVINFDLFWGFVLVLFSFGFEGN